MALKTARFNEAAKVEVDQALCTGCGTCAKVCRGAPLSMEGKQVKVDQTHGWGCIGCGQCVTVCPVGAIHVTGRDLGPADVLPMPPPESRADYASLNNLLLTRRSVRDFAARDVEPEMVRRIVEAASTAPMGLPPSDVRVLVFDGREKVRAFRDDLFAELKGWKWMYSGVGSLLMRPFLSKELREVMQGFVRPVTEAYEEKEREGVDWFFYGAPLALYFHASAYADPADPVVAATYAMIAAQSLGLGSTMLGFPGIILKRSKALKKKYGVDANAEAGLAVIFGYPAVRYHRVLRRRFGEVRRWGEENAA
ncbi:MAG: nitroreductase family protein [Deltaproteobacteria bacterium]|nr:nitroreductase family protein [Deltaproteobacteria bacterium]